jgi:hypothetical protein
MKMQEIVTTFTIVQAEIDKHKVWLYSTQISKTVLINIVSLIGNTNQRI